MAFPDVHLNSPYRRGEKNTRSEAFSTYALIILAARDGTDKCPWGPGLLVAEGSISLPCSYLDAFPDAEVLRDIPVSHSTLQKNVVSFLRGLPHCHPQWRSQHVWLLVI